MKLPERSGRKCADQTTSGSVKSFQIPSPNPSRDRTATLCPKRCVNCSAGQDQRKQKGTATAQTAKSLQDRSVTNSRRGRWCQSAQRTIVGSVITRQRRLAQRRRSSVITRQRRLAQR